ncbi:DUF2269 domain-containing protein [Corynebacterium kutscheri]|uniref:Hypothetical membrane protein n=1 Tax=Corynebacterium kutscheri TaxID=35755 RepID=A0AB38VTK4_9CORY|nr:DUF2269 domain-containing protein [Corynebacterium kutscheri]VEH08951.1 hypothetical membrane protein [Corynebacterium kutscheri]
MNTILITLHVIAAILFLGSVTVAVSTFHVRALAAHNGDETARGSAVTLHKIAQTYGNLSVLVPILGFGIMFTANNYWSDGRFHASIALSLVAWIILLFVIVPRQKKMLGSLGLLDADEQASYSEEITDWNKAKAQLSMFGGIFSLLWVVIAVLMLI